jgi:DNA-binding NarL/FixJ family response regulator
MGQETTAVDDVRCGSSDGVRILLADNFEPWRSLIRSFLHSETQWKVVCEARDGLEAVRKTIEMRPDVVLLDIGMPGLNGIEAARSISNLCVDCKVIFLTENSDGEVKAAALDTGALAYVLKHNLLKDLKPAIHAAVLAVDGNQ